MRAPTSLRAALICVVALCLAAGCDPVDPVEIDAGRDASAGPVDAGVDAGGGGDEDAGSQDDDAGGGDEDAGTSEEDAGTTPEDDAGTMADGGLDGGFSMDGGTDGGEPDAGPPDGGSPAPVVINEFAFAHNTGFEGGNAHEYVEIFGAPDTDYSDLTILYVNGNAPASSGRIDNVIPVGTTDAMGYWVHHTDPTMDVFRNSSSTLLLVRGFTGAVGDDLDTDADGVLDVMPFTEIVDDVSIIDADTADHTYSATVLPRDFGGSGGNAAACSRIPDGTDTDTIADWVRNDGAGIGLPGGPTTASDGEGINTPGAENAIYSAP